MWDFGDQQIFCLGSTPSELDSLLTCLCFRNGDSIFIAGVLFVCLLLWIKGNILKAQSLHLNLTKQNIFITLTLQYKKNYDMGMGMDKKERVVNLKMGIDDKEVLR